jgi:hypothetical protein
MGTILVGLQSSRATVDECHVNLWRLPGWPDDLHLLDIGLSITNSSTQPIGSFQLGIPARPRANDATCLVSRISDLQSWQLIFRDCKDINHRPGRYWHRTLVRASHPSFRMTTVTLAPEPTPHQSKADLSLWKVSFRKSLPPRQQTYIRVRFRIKRAPGAPLGMLSISRDLGIYERVRTYDIRVNEIREQVDVAPLLPLFTRAAQIQRAFVFLVTREGYTPRVVSPTVRYVRLLEGKAWQHYLQRRIRPFRVGRTSPLLIYSWDTKDTGEFRAFASFHRDLGRLDPLTISITVFLALVALAFAHPNWLKDAVHAVAAFFQAYPIPASICVALPSIAYPVARFVERVARRLDAFFYATTMES